MTAFDSHRVTEILRELSDFQPELKADRIGSTVTLGEIVALCKRVRFLESRLAEMAVVEIQRIPDQSLSWLEKQSDARCLQRVSGCQCPRCTDGELP